MGDEYRAFFTQGPPEAQNMTINNLVKKVAEKNTNLCVSHNLKGKIDNLGIRIELRTATGQTGYQEGEEVKIYALATSAVANELIIEVYILVSFASKTQTYAYYDGTLQPIWTHIIRPASKLVIPAYASQIPYLLTGQWRLESIIAADNIMLIAGFAIPDTGVIRFCEKLDFDITPGMSSFTGVLRGAMTLEPYDHIDPDGGNPIQGLGATRLPDNHWFSTGPWDPWGSESNSVLSPRITLNSDISVATQERLSSGLDDYGFFNVRTFDGRPMVQVKLRSAFLDNCSRQNVNYRNDAWFHFLIRIPPGVMLHAPVAVELSFQQKGQGNYWIWAYGNDYGAYDWSFFRPLIRVVGKNGDERIVIQDWYRISNGMGIDDYTFRFTVELPVGHLEWERFIEVAQGPPYPPSRINNLFSEPWLLRFQSAGLLAEPVLLGYGGLSALYGSPYKENNLLRGLWISRVTDMGITKPVVLTTAPHLEPTANFVMEGMLECLISNPSIADNLNFLFFFDMDPDGRKWGTNQAYPANGLNPSWWYYADQDSVEASAVRNYVLGELKNRRGLEMRTLFELHCEVAPRSRRRMPICGCYGWADQSGFPKNEIENFINNYANRIDQTLGGKYVRPSSEWVDIRQHFPLNVLPNVGGYDFRHYIVVELPQVAFYPNSLEQPSTMPIYQEIGPYILGDNDQRLFKLGHQFLWAAFDSLW